MIHFNFDKDCCGCRACEDRCPKKCISIAPNKYGFVVPKVDVSKCIQCGLCDRICPYLNTIPSETVFPRVFSAYAINDEIRECGSSGSIFYLLASYIIKESGIVYGAAFSTDLKVRHVGAETLEDLIPLMKSKYIQSDTKNIYSQVIANLKSGRKVMFVGTPCQTRALFNILNGKKPDNLLLIDFICHGVPSQELFDKSIAKWEKDHNRTILDFSFRKKSQQSLHRYSIRYQDNKDKEVHTEEGLSKEFPFYLGYLRYNIFRDSCYSCKYLGSQRVSDITLGDFWFLDKLKPITDFNRGYSMIVVNSAKGQQMFNLLRNDKLVDAEEFTVDTAVKYNHAYTKPTRKSIVHKLFKHAYISKPYDDIEKYYFGTEFTFLHKIVRIIIRELKL